MATTPLLLVTDVGLAVASVATPVGPFIHVTGFKIGSAYGYDPQRTDTGLNGNILYSGQPISYQNIGDNTINIVLRIPADAGPFDFGEVGIFIGDNADVLFAKAVFESPQTKFSSLGTNLQSTYTFNCLLKLEQSVAVFKIDTENGIPPSIWEVDKWSDIYPPGVSANPDTPAILCRELDGNDNSSFLHKASDEKWTLGTNYQRYGARTVAAGTTSSVQFPKSQFPNVNPSLALDHQFVIEFADGFFRAVTSVISSGTNWQFNLAPDPLPALPTVGSQAILYNNNGISFATLTDVPLMTTAVQGIARADHGIQIIAPGVIAVNGMNHGAPGTGRLLTGGDNLNYVGWPSGIYSTDVNNVGAPGNYPPVGGVNGAMHIMNDGGQLITQTWYPSGLGGGDPSGQNAQPAYFRSCYDVANSLWTAWRSIRISGAAGEGKTWYNVTGIRPNGSFVLNDSNDEITVSVSIDSASGGQIVGAAYVDGTQVASYNYRNNRYNNAGGWSYPVAPGSQYMNLLNGDNRVITIWSEYRSTPP